MASSTDEVLHRIDQGFRFVAGGSDARLLASTASTMYKAIWEGPAQRTTAPRS